MAIWQILLAAAVIYGAIWSYFEASRLRDQFHIGAGPGGLAPQAWAALICLGAPIAFPLFLTSRDRASLQEPRAGAPPVFTQRGFSPWGVLGITLGVAGAGALVYFGMPKLAPLGLLVAALAFFGARRSVMTDEMVTSSLPVSFEQVGFRPLRQGQQEEHEEEDAGFVLNLDRAVPPSALAARPPALPSMPAAGAPFAAAPVVAAPFVAAPLPPVAPLRPPSSSVSVQIAPGSSILWAAADEGDLEPEDPRATIAAANPEVFRQLGGIFAPPPAGAASAPVQMPTVQVPAAYPGPMLNAPRAPEPAPAAFAGPMVNAPAPFQLPMQVPAAYSGPPPAAAAPRQAAGTYRSGATPGGFVAGKPVPDGSRWIVIAALIALAGVGAAAWWRFGHPVEAPLDEPAVVDPGSVDPGSADPGSTDPGNVDPGIAALPAPAAAGAGEPGEGKPSMVAWLDLYRDYFGPIGLLFEKIDYEGFNPPAVCDDLQLAISAAREGLPTAPDEQLEYEVRVCFDPLQQTAEACQEHDSQRWSAALLGAKACTHRAQARMVDDHGFAGLLELELESAQGIDRSTQSMSGRYLKAGGVAPSLD
jgi:hypothetical protein